MERGTDSDMEGRVNVTAMGEEWESNSVSVTESVNRNVGLDDKPLKSQRVQ